MFSGREKGKWMVDSGASYHIVSDVNLMEEFLEEILVANGSTMLSRGKGLVKLNINGKQLTLEHCLFIPEVSRNIISVSQLNDKNYQVFFSKDSCSIERNEDVFSLTGENGIFIFNTTPVVMMALNSEVLHQRFGHPGRIVENGYSTCSNLQRMCRRRAYFSAIPERKSCGTSKEKSFGIDPHGHMWTITNKFIKWRAVHFVYS